MRSVIINEKNDWRQCLVPYYRLKYPLDYARFQAIKQQIEINNEISKMRLEIIKYGRIQLTGITTI